LKHTEVRGAISGFLARVTVTQIFANSAPSAIEAVYVFPLPQNAAVDDMTIQVGERTIRSLIKKLDEARAIYERAKATGHVAALLDQERPNIFSQAVANIMPGEQVSVTISYVETLEYEDGTYKFAFPMVVGPRYIPGQAMGKQAGGWAPDTNKVPDASRITPPVAVTGARAGHDISLDLAIDAGAPIRHLRSSSHQIDIERTGPSTARVRLRNQAEIANKDFILRYQVAGGEFADAVLAQAAPVTTKLRPGGYFTVILQSPVRVPESDITPKELVFVLALESKLHPALVEAFDCAAQQQQECKLVHGGKVEVQVWLKKGSTTVLEQLRRAGFEPTTDNSKARMFIGHLPLEKLQALAQIADVQFVSPVRC
jgi:Ca-activated chloride channel family protein